MEDNHQNPRPLALLAGRQSESFAETIAQKFNMKTVSRLIKTFPNGEIEVEILESVRGFEVFIIQTFIPGKINDGIIELLLLADAVRRAGSPRVRAVLRIYPYARQDRREGNKKNRHKRKPVSARLIADLISLKFDSVIAFDWHAEQIEGFFDGNKVTAENIQPFILFSEYLKKNNIIKEKYLNEKEKPIMVAPDVGSSKRVSDYADNLRLNYAIVDKRRKNGTDVDIRNVIGDVQGHPCIIVDDISATGGTLIGAKKALTSQGATDVMVVVTHLEAIGVKDIEKLAEAGFSKIIVTDSITLPDEIKNYPVFEVISLIPIMTKVIHNVYNSESLQSVVFEG